MAKTVTQNTKKLKPFEKLLTIMNTGNPVTVEEIEATLGKEIHMYRLSTYMWHIKTMANGVVKSIKDGRKVTAYQIVNIDEVNKFMKSEGITSAGFTPGKTQKIVRKKTKNVATSLSDLKAQPQQTEEFEITEVTPETVEVTHE